jgi:hypothetical protein
LTPSMEVAVVSGMVVVVATRIDLIQKMNARKRASSQVEKTSATCPKFTDHALDIIQCGIMTVIEIHAHTSFTEDVLETQTDLKKLKTVRHSVLLMIKFVSINILAFIFRVKRCFFISKIAACDQPIESGVCSGSFDRWGYDKERDACVPFRYGGCKGNKNNYKTEAACEYSCKKPGVGKSEYS